MKKFTKLILLCLIFLVAVLSLIIGKKVLENYKTILPVNKSKTVLLYENSGGFAGVCDRLQITENDQYFYEDYCRINSNQYKREGTLDSNDGLEFKKLIDEFGYVEYKWNDRMVDGFQGSLKFYGAYSINSGKNRDQIGIFANKIISKIKQGATSMQNRTVCLGLRISLPSAWRLEEIKGPTQGPLEGITYEASINKNKFKILDTNNQEQLGIICFQPMEIDENSKQIKESLTIDEAVEILKPTRELSDFNSVKFNTSSVSQEQCAHFEQWALPNVVCRLPFGIGCGKAPEGMKIKDVFICPKAGDKSTGAFIYEIIKYHQNTSGRESILNNVFDSLSF